MYNEVNCIDTSFHTFEYKGEIITFQDCIDRMIVGLKLELTLDEYDDKRKEEDIKNKLDDILPLFTLCYRCLWW